jgi:hypothetical protein
MQKPVHRSTVQDRFVVFKRGTWNVEPGTLFYYSLDESPITNIIVVWIIFPGVRDFPFNAMLTHLKGGVVWQL